MARKFGEMGAQALVGCTIVVSQTAGHHSHGLPPDGKRGVVTQTGGTSAVRNLLRHRRLGDRRFDYGARAFGLTFA